MKEILRDFLRHPGALTSTLFVLAALAAAVLAWQAEAQADQPVVIDGTAVPPVPTLDAARVAEGRALYAAHCAGCHGVRGEGAPNWKTPAPNGSFPPPPHDDNGHTWHHPDAVLLEVIANGGDPALGSRMPAFGSVLTEAERLAVLDYLKSTWGQEARAFQWWVTVK